MNSVEVILLENIDKPNACFIFPTDIAASRWADHLLRLRGGSVAMKKFIAWDIFKQNSIKSRVQDKKSIPSALRKIFVSRLVKENAQACLQEEEPLFRSLIRTQWAAQASQFAPWLSGMLPQLGSWFKKTVNMDIKDVLSDSAASAAAGFEGDYLDMFTLAKRYAQFLDTYNLFEPAWERPPFNDEGKECFIFFPESLSDYSEYKEILSSSPHVKIINIGGTESLACDTFFYTNSRREITQASLYIRALHENFNIAWDAIAVCIPDTENYEPYVTREFNNRNIPFVKRTSKALTDYPAGSLFNCILDCVSQDYSFSSLTSLVLNKNLPWKDTENINKLITFGIENNCLYSWTETENEKKQHINVWEDAFSKPCGSLDTQTKKFFENLKRRLSALRTASSFNEVRKQYFIFREQFLDMSQCSDETDLVLSRCISELTELTELEKNFPDVPASDHFLFFAEYLKEIFYLAQQKTGGVALLPYKTAAAAVFDCHIVLGAGQDSLSVVYSKLDFLPRKKREEIGIFDEDASSCFINLHKLNSAKISAFFCSEKTFSGFTIPHSGIKAHGEPKERYNTEPEMEKKFSKDYYSAERQYCSAISNAASNAANAANAASTAASCEQPEKLHENQVQGYTNWKKRREESDTPDKKTSSNEILRNFIKERYAKTGKYSVSATSLQSYFQCSLIWLFERVFNLENVQIETSLMAENISGLVYHEVLNNFFTEIKNKNEKLCEPDTGENGAVLPALYKKLLKQSVNDVFNNFTRMSALTERLLKAGQNDFEYHLENFLVSFLTNFAGCRIAGTEISSEAEMDTYTLRGTLDCVLEEISDNGESKYIIVDFKLKKLPKRQECTAEDDEGLSNFQLPMYITLTEENKKYKVYTALFYSILDLKSEVLIGSIQDTFTKKVTPKKEEERINRGDERYKLIFDEFNKKTNQFSQEISSGNFTVFESNEKNCRECRYNRICRTVYVINKKKNITLGNN